MKAQALVDFIVEFIPSYGDLDRVDEAKTWVIYVDGSSTLYV